MAMPSLSHEDLQKLKDFIDFVTANPKILNFPKLDFVKKFIEKFGGKVPPGEFQMPGECKCPFSGGGGAAGGVKTEGNTAEAEEDSEPDEAEMESDPESEIELDMEVKNLQNPDGDKRQAINSVFVTGTTEDNDVKEKRKAVKKIKKDISEDEEYNIPDSASEDEECNMTDCASGEEEDPINTTLEPCIKAEIKESSENDFDYHEEVSDESEEIVENSKKPKCRTYRTRQTSSSKKKTDKDFWASLSERKKVKRPKRFNCTKSCKQNCNTKIDKKWCQELCAKFWGLSRVERKNYVSELVVKKPVLRLKIVRTKRSSCGFTNRYFLKNRSEEKVRVCLGFFLSTLSISGYFVKNALESIDSTEDLIVPENSNANKVDGDGTKEDHTIEDNSNTVKQNEIIAKQIIPEEGASTSKEKQKEVSEILQRPKPNRPSMKGRIMKKDHVPQPVKCDEICKMKCTRYFSEEQRGQICATYWSMDYKRRKDFLLSRVQTRDVATMTNEIYRKMNSIQRKISNRFYFRGNRGENIRVCLNFFTSTLCIGRRTIDHAIQNADPNTGSYVGEDKRGRHTPANKIPEEMLNEVKRHIESYPTWVPHKKYKTRFLHSSLNIIKMYREYKQACVEKQWKYVTSTYFRSVFHKQYRLAFLKPTSKHAHKVGLNRKDKDGEVVAYNRNNPNVSEFTGEEGGFWIPAATPIVVAVEQIGNEPQLQRLQCPQINDVNTFDVNRFGIQQNSQHQGPQFVQQTSLVNEAQCSGIRNFFRQEDGKQESQQNDSQVLMTNYTNAAYAQDPSLFRIL